MEAKGNTLLKIVGVLLIIGGLISALFALVILSGMGLFAIGSEVTAAAGTTDIMALLASLEKMIFPTVGTTILALVGGIFSFIGGIFGLKYANITEKAGFCMGFGLLMILIQVAAAIITITSGTFSIIAVIAGLIFPVLYFIGAFLNRSSAPAKE